MVEPLLRSNSRLAMLRMGAAGLAILAGAFTLLFAQGSWARQFAGALLLLLGCLSILSTLQGARRPRLGYRHGELLVYLRVGRPLRVPIEVVEAFFLGQGPALGAHPGARGDSAGPVAASVVVRLAEAARAWHRRDVREVLGSWKDGYITVRGLWCEPITPEVIQRMNRRLMEIKRQRRQESSEMVP